MQESLHWWQRLTNQTSAQLLEMPLSCITAAKLAGVARAQLSIPSTTASVERLFSEAGYLDSHQRRQQSMWKLEMLLTIRGFVHQRLATPEMVSVVQTDLCSARAQRYLRIANELAVSIADDAAAQQACWQAEGV